MAEQTDARDERVDRLAAEVADLRARLARLTVAPDRRAGHPEPVPAPEALDPEPISKRPRRRRKEPAPRRDATDAPEVSRRRLFGLLGGAAAVGTGLAVAGSGLTAQSADAAAGDPVILGSPANDAGANYTYVSSSDHNYTFNINNSSTTGAAALFSASDGVPQVWLNAGGAHTGPPTGGSAAGQVYVDSTGALFYCNAGGTPGKWSKQAPLVFLPAPHRVYDSRVGQPNHIGQPQGPLIFTSPPPNAAFRNVIIETDSTTGNVLIPPTTSAVLLNLAVIPISGVGALAVYPPSAPQPSTSSINWSAGVQVLANSVTSAIGVSFVFQTVAVAIVAGAGASTDFVIDLIGYYPF
jgi:hypothetical protein